MNTSTVFDINDDEAYVALLANLWRFLAPSTTVGVADAIFVFGGIDIEVPRWAAALWQQKVAPSVLVTGKAGLLTSKHFNDKTEADVFADELIRAGVPDASILRETEATNTGQNVEFGMKTLTDQGIEVRSLILVAKPFIMRRCIATFAKQFPNISVLPSPPPCGIIKSIDRNRSEYALRLVAEVERLSQYSKKGFIEPVIIPDDVRNSIKTVESLFS